MPPDDLLSDQPAPGTPPPASPPPGDPVPPPAPPDKPATPAPDLAPDPNKDFIKTLPKDLQENASLGRYSNTESLARAYVNLEEHTRLRQGAGAERP